MRSGIGSKYEGRLDVLATEPRTLPLCLLRCRCGCFWRGSRVQRGMRLLVVLLGLVLAGSSCHQAEKQFSNHESTATNEFRLPLELPLLFGRFVSLGRLEHSAGNQNCLLRSEYYHTAKSNNMALTFARLTRTSSVTSGSLSTRSHTSRKTWLTSKRVPRQDARRI